VETLHVADENGAGLGSFGAERDHVIDTFERDLFKPFRTLG
jgi:hypothetical protein